MASFPTSGDDTLFGTPAADTIDGLGGNDTITGLQGGDDLFGGAGDDSISGDGGADFLRGGTGDDTLIGGDDGGFDQLIGDAGNDRLDGGGGFDAVRYSREFGLNAVNVNLATGIAIDTFGNQDTLAGIERIEGTSRDDTLIGGGDDGFEDFRGFDGADLLDGGSGFDRVDYAADRFWGGTSAVNVNFATGIGIDGFGNMDTLANFERVRSTIFDDTLTGGNPANDDYEGFAVSMAMTPSMAAPAMMALSITTTFSGVPHTA